MSTSISVVGILFCFTIIVQFSKASKNQGSSTPFPTWFAECESHSRCILNDSCVARIQYCRNIYCLEDTIKLKDLDYSDNHANCIHHCLIRLFQIQIDEYDISYLTCVFSPQIPSNFYPNQPVNFFEKQGFTKKTSIELFNTKLKVLIINLGSKHDQFIFLEQLLLKKSFNIQRINEHLELNALQGLLNPQTRLIFGIEDLNLIEKNHCKFESIGQRRYDILTHPIRYIQLLTRRDCLNIILEEFDETLAQSVGDDSEILFRSQKFLLKSYFIDFNKQFMDEVEAIQELKKITKSYLLKPINSNKDSDIKYIASLEQFTDQLHEIQYFKNARKLKYKMFLLEESLSNPLLVEQKFVEISFHVVIITTTPFLAYAVQPIIKTSSCSSENKFKPKNNISETNNCLSEYSLDDGNLIIPIRMKKNVLTNCYAAITYALYAYNTAVESYGNDSSSLGEENSNSFSILRFDFQLDSKYQTFLTKISGNPYEWEGIHLSDMVNIQLQNLIETTLNYAYLLKNQKPNDYNSRKDWINVNRFGTSSDYELLIDESKDFIYLVDVY